MDRTAEDTGRGPTVGRSLPPYRLGDVALFLFWVLFAAIRAVSTVRAEREHDILASVHHGVIAVVFLVNGSLFLLRGPAVGGARGLYPKLVAIVGSYIQIPLAVLPLTWRPDWLLGMSSIGLIGAYVFVLWALLTLRRSFSIFPEARRLVRHGPYALIRHPLYAAYITTYVLTALPRFSVPALALATIGVTGEVIRARNEERVLRAAFVDYDAYAAETSRFLPRIVARSRARAEDGEDSLERVRPASDDVPSSGSEVSPTDS